MSTTTTNESNGSLPTSTPLELKEYVNARLQSLLKGTGQVVKPETLHHLGKNGGFGVPFRVETVYPNGVPGSIIIKSVARNDNETKILKIIKGKPELKGLTPTFYGTYKLPTRKFIFMEGMDERNGWIDGLDFQKRLLIPDEHNKISQQQFGQLLSNLVAGLRRLHAAGIVHHDIKLENIFINPSNDLQVMFIDFGLSCYDYNGDCITNIPFTNLFTFLQHKHETTSGTSKYMYLMDTYNGSLYKDASIQNKKKLDFWSMKVLVQALLVAFFNQQDIFTSEYFKGYPAFLNAKSLTILTAPLLDDKANGSYGQLIRSGFISDSFNIYAKTPEHVSRTLLLT